MKICIKNKSINTYSIYLIHTRKKNIPPPPQRLVNDKITELQRLTGQSQTVLGRCTAALLELEPRPLEGQPQISAQMDAPGHCGDCSSGSLSIDFPLPVSLSDPGFRLTLLQNGLRPQGARSQAGSQELKELWEREWKEGVGAVER